MTLDDRRSAVATTCDPATENTSKRKKRERRADYRPAVVRPMLTALLRHPYYNDGKADVEHPSLGNKDAVAEDLNVSTEMIKIALKSPNWTPLQIVEEKIRSQFSKVCTVQEVPWAPQHIADARALFIEAKAKRKTESGRIAFAATVRMFDDFLKSYASNNPVKMICTKSFHVGVLFHAARHLGLSGMEQSETFARAKAAAQQACSMASAYLADGSRTKLERDACSRETERVKINLIAVHVEESKISEKAHKNLRPFLVREEALAALKRFVGYPCYRHLFQPAYNGLEVAMIECNPEKAFWFYNELTKVDPGFLDLEYDPGEVPPLKGEDSPQVIKDFCRLLHAQKKNA